MDVELPEPLQSEYRALLKEFADVKDTYAYYADETIPTDPAYQKRILEFIVKALDYMEINYEKLELQAWGAFLYNFVFDFEYGDPRDSRNYLAFDELDLVSNLQKFSAEEVPELKQIMSVRKKLERVLR